MRLIVFALLSLLCVSCASTPPQPVSSVQIKEIKPRYIKEEEFKRVREYLTGAEHKGNRVIVRTDAEVRDGYYFTLVLDEKVARLPKGTTILGEFYTPDSPEKQEYIFLLPERRQKTHEIFLGLTGEAWPTRGKVPSAWRFTIKDASGRILAQKKSYLWNL